jgi:hypothetical protein
MCLNFNARNKAEIVVRVVGPPRNFTGKNTMVRQVCPSHLIEQIGWLLLSAEQKAVFQTKHSMERA